MNEHGWWDNCGIPNEGNTTERAVAVAENAVGCLNTAIDAINRSNDDRDELKHLLQGMLSAHGKLVGDLRAMILELADQYRLSGDVRFRELGEALQRMLVDSSVFIKTRKEEPGA